MADSFNQGDRVEYVDAPVFDGIVATGDIGWVTKVEGSWVFAMWPRSGVHSVPVSSVRLLPPTVTRTVGQAANARMWSLLGKELPPLSTGKANRFWRIQRPIGSSRCAMAPRMRFG